MICEKMWSEQLDCQHVRECLLAGVPKTRGKKGLGSVTTEGLGLWLPKPGPHFLLFPWGVKIEGGRERMSTSVLGRECNSYVGTMATVKI